MSDWMPIETAPKDGRKVDLWLVNEKGEGWREADAYWVDDGHEDFSSYDNGMHEYKHASRSGWWAPNHDYDGAAGFCDQPVRNYGNPLRPTWIKPTHWMPPPPAPKAQSPEIVPNDVRGLFADTQRGEA